MGSSRSEYFCVYLWLPRCCPYHGVGVGHLEELGAALGVPEGADPQAVGRVQLLHQEVAAHLNHLGELQEARSSQQTLYSVFL